MKRMLLICMVAVYCYANQEEFFLQGNKFYQDGSFQQALEAYQKIDRKSASVLYNLGNCFYCLCNYRSAIVNWRAADAIGSWRIHKKIDLNCALAYKKLGKEYSMGVSSSIYYWLVRAINTISLFWWQLLFLIIWIPSIVILIQAMDQRRYWRFCSLTVLICSVMICFMIRYRSATHSYALIVDDEVAIRAGPADNYGIIASAHCLDEFDIDGKNGDWLKIHDKSLAGWICCSTAAVIDPKDKLMGKKDYL